MMRWPHQLHGVQQVLAAIAAGWKRIILCSPTGGGKTTMMEDLIRAALEREQGVSLYTNRRMLLDQLEDDLKESSLSHGLRASGRHPRLTELLQLSSMQTEGSRCLGEDAKWQLHDAGLVLVDEAHIQKGPRARKILDRHQAEGAAIVGVTATPLDMEGMYDHLIVAGTNSSLRACGALVPAYHFAPDEPSTKWLPKKVSIGDDISEKDNVRAIMTPTVFGRVHEWWEKLNPEHKPTVLYGPSQGSSLWFAERFHEAGISSAHIDSDVVWINGTTYRTSPETRKEVARLHQAGEVKLVTNRYVMREGINWPWIEHLILAFVAGSLKTYLQIGGRGLRACPATGKTGCIIQDHGGSWWRHGSLNEDRLWHLGQTSRETTALSLDRKRNPQEGDAPQAARCPACSAILRFWKCLQCGHEIPRGTLRSRPVVELDGSLSEMTGVPVKPRRHMSDADKAARLWERMYHRAKSEKWDATFFQAEAMFAQENNFAYPPRGIPLMPVNQADMARKVRDVPVEKLVPKLEVVPT